MENQFIIKNIKPMGLLLAISLLTSCGGGGSADDKDSYSNRNSPYISAQQFVSSLNANENSSGQSNTTLTQGVDETHRSQVWGEDDWFVIYDDVYNEHKAVSLQYIRSIEYYDYYSNSDAVASEFRTIELDDIALGDQDGDIYGDNYEVVDYNFFTDSYWGVNSGFQYEDSEETLDTALMAGEKEKLKFFKKASGVSYAYSLSISTSMALVTLGTKIEKMIGKNQGEITEEDQLAITSDMVKLTGVSLDEILNSRNDKESKQEVLEKIADKIGTQASNLESNILPNLFGVTF